VIEAVAVLAQRLDLVHGDVGVAQQFVDGLAVARVDSDTNRG
jgi:hypothetical protein